MNDINAVIMTGRLTDEPDLRGTNNDIMTFTIAVNRSIKDGDDWKEEAQFFEWIRYKTSEKFAAMLHKGMLVTCKGNASIRKVESKKYKDKDGNHAKYDSIQFIVDGRDGLSFALPPRDAQSAPKKEPSHYPDGQPIEGGPEDFEDEIPF